MSDPTTPQTIDKKKHDEIVAFYDKQKMALGEEQIALAHEATQYYNCAKLLTKLLQHIHQDFKESIDASVNSFYINNIERVIAEYGIEPLTPAQLREARMGRGEAEMLAIEMEDRRYEDEEDEERDYEAEEEGIAGDADIFEDH